MSDHVGLEEGTFDDEVVVKHRLHDGTEHTLGYSSASLNVMISVSENLWLNDWHQAVVLANGSVSGQRVSSLVDGQLGWSPVANLEHGSPLGKAAPLLVEGLCAGCQAVQTLRGRLVIGAAQNDQTLVEFDASVDVSRTEQLNEVLALGRSLVNRLLKHDHTRDVLFDFWCGEKELAIVAAISLVVLHRDRIESLSDGARGLVSSQDSLAGGRDLTRRPNQFFFEVKLCFNHC